MPCLRFGTLLARRWERICDVSCVFGCGVCVVDVDALEGFAMSDDIYNDILWRLRIPLPYELRGLTVQDIASERNEAADEIERLRADRDRWRKLAGAFAAVSDCQCIGCKAESHKLWKELFEAVRGD